MMTKKRTIGKYRLIEEVASGAFGRVYRAEDSSQHNHVVALKVMHTAHLGLPQERESFLREAQFLKMLRHPSILPLLDADIEDEFPYIVTMYAPNGSLHDRLKNQAPRPLSVQESLNALAQIGQALSYAHQRNIIHRDLKPANILFDANNNALLADFGIATVLASSMRSGTAVGTPAYMAPEQFRGTVSKEGDQYALGCIAYELLTGRVPFTAPDFFALGYKHMSEKPVQPSQLNLLVPHSIEDAILTAMAKQRSDRHVSVDAFLYALGGVTASPLPSFATSSASTVLPALPASPRGVMPQSATEWARILSPNAAVDGGMMDGAMPPSFDEVSQESFPSSFDGVSIHHGYSQVEEETGKTPIITHTSPRAFSTRQLRSGDVLSLQDIVGEEMVENMEYTMLPATPIALQEATTPPPLSATPSPSWATTTNVPGSFSPTATQARKRHPLKSSRGLAMIASLAAVLLLLLSGGLYVLLETPYPKSIAAAIRTHDITKLLPPTAQPTTQARSSKKTTSASSVVQVVTNNGSTPIPGSTTPVGPPPTTPPPGYAFVTITPTTTQANQQFTVDAVEGSPSGSQVQARQLTSTNQQGFTATSTGQGTTQATAASGTITLFNNTTAPVTVTTGTTITTNDSALSFTTQQDATVPIPASGQQWGSASVTVVAQTTGTSGNIAAQAINAQCCTSAGTVYAINESAFTGGQDAQTYTFLQQSDIDSTTAPVISSLESSVTASLSTQVRANEQTIGNASCSTPSVTTTSPVNSHVASTTGTVSVTCTQEVYDVQGAQANAATMLQQQEKSAGYTLTSQTSTSVASASVVGLGTVAIVVNTSAPARSVFTTASCQKIAGMIAGKSVSQVQSMLASITGVASAVIQISASNANVLPMNASNITVTATS